MRLLLYNQDKNELKKMSYVVVEALQNEKAMLDECCSFLDNKRKLNNVIYDIAIIDLSVGREDAKFLVHHLRQNNSECMIILLGSNYKESVFAFDIKASLFVLKEDCDLKKELKKVIVTYKKNNPWIYFHHDEKKTKIYLKDILFVEVASKSLRVVCIDKEYISLRKENKDVIDVLCKYGFIKVHQSYYISLKNIISFKKGEITLTNHENVSVSLKYRKNLKEKLNMFIDICG